MCLTLEKVTQNQNKCFTLKCMIIFAVYDQETPCQGLLKTKAIYFQIVWITSKIVVQEWKSFSWKHITDFYTSGKINDKRFELYRNLPFWKVGSFTCGSDKLGLTIHCDLIAQKWSSYICLPFIFPYSKQNISSNTEVWPICRRTYIRQTRHRGWIWHNLCKFCPSFVYYILEHASFYYILCIWVFNFVSFYNIILVME